MGVFFYIHSVALVEDLAVEAHYSDPNEFYAAADTAFLQVRDSSIDIEIRNHLSHNILHVSVVVGHQLLDRCPHLPGHSGLLRLAVPCQQPPVRQLSSCRHIPSKEAMRRGVGVGR